MDMINELIMCYYRRWRCNGRGGSCWTSGWRRL